MTPLPLLQVLIGAEYHHRPTGCRVVLLDGIYRHRRRSHADTAHTGRYIARVVTDPGAPWISVDPADLEPL